MKERKVLTKQEGFNLTAGLRTDFGELRSPLQAETAHTAIATNAPREHAKTLADRLNTVHHTTNEFRNPAYNPRIIAVTHTPDGLTSISTPSAPYTPLSTLIVAEDASLAQRPLTLKPTEPDDLDMVPSQTIYDMTPSLQIAYWQAMLGTRGLLENFLDEKGETESHTIFAGENCISVRTDGVRTSKSMGIPHGHITPVHHGAIRELPILDEDMGQVAREQRLLARIGQKLGDDVYSYLSDEARGLLVDTMEGHHENLKLRKRLAMPFGYSMQFTKGIPVDEFAEFMRGHHQAYTKMASEIVNGLGERLQKEIIPQPSYRLYLTGNEMIISPETISHGGLYEAAGIKLDRSVTNPSPYQNGIVYDARNRIKAANQ